jgi:hypothetical protein
MQNGGKEINEAHIYIYIQKYPGLMKLTGREAG